jgi:hypothetical protein
MYPRNTIRVLSFSTSPSDVIFTRYLTVTGMIVVLVRGLVSDGFLFDKFLQFLDEGLDPECLDVGWIGEYLFPIVRCW